MKVRLKLLVILKKGVLHSKSFTPFSSLLLLKTRRVSLGRFLKHKHIVEVPLYHPLFVSQGKPLFSVCDGSLESFSYNSYSHTQYNIENLLFLFFFVVGPMLYKLLCDLIFLLYCKSGDFVLAYTYRSTLLFLTAAPYFITRVCQKPRSYN